MTKPKKNRKNRKSRRSVIPPAQRQRLAEYERARRNAKAATAREARAEAGPLVCQNLNFTSLPCDDNEAILRPWDEMKEMETWLANAGVGVCSNAQMTGSGLQFR